ncbi:prostate stem cell antigen-like [Alosa pseudoharengus]|uniref:prostate stem cell antigen-like n=1 Tax=Alosa pseudoharengus TaxID=34774 RepID=UPI003F89C7FD
MHTHTYLYSSANMKNLPGLLVLFLCVHSVDTLKCYVCSATNSNEQCNQNSQDCNPPLDTCMSTIDTMNGVKAIVKQCASRATCSGAAASASVDNAGNGNKVNCCSSRLCNYSGAANIRPHTWLLALPLSLLTFTLLGLQ